jgi:Stage II sporulation protein E (SpoIIE)
MAQARTAEHLSNFLYERSQHDLLLLRAQDIYSVAPECGALPPILVHRERNGSFSIDRLEDGGPVLGVLPGAFYLQAEVTVDPGEVLVMFSDGITEAENSSGEDFGERRLLAAICNNWDAATRDLCDAVLGDLRSFLGGLNPQDDQTLMFIRPRPAARELTNSDCVAVGCSQSL